jgi:signal transduction histidine kinase
VACEALANTVKHARASRVEVHARRQDGHLVLTVRDDGIGGAHPSRGSGLRGLSDRVAAQGGRIGVESQRGLGTTLTAELPCAL